MPVFKHTGCRNYALEEFKLLTQTILMSPRQVAELKWARTVNTVGRIGHNIPCDLTFKQEIKVYDGEPGF